MALMLRRLDRLEEKVDKLLAFRAYVMGVGAVFGMLGAWFITLIKGY